MPTGERDKALGCRRLRKIDRALEPGRPRYAAVQGDARGGRRQSPVQQPERRRRPTSRSSNGSEVLLGPPFICTKDNIADRDFLRRHGHQPGANGGPPRRASNGLSPALLVGKTPWLHKKWSGTLLEDNFKQLLKFEHNFSTTLLIPALAKCSRPVDDL